MLTGHVDRWDIFIAVPAAVGAGGLALCSVLSYLRLTDKSRMDAVRFLARLYSSPAFSSSVFGSSRPGTSACLERCFQPF
jgi:hypothetical protein